MIWSLFKRKKSNQALVDAQYEAITGGGAGTIVLSEMHAFPTR
jgi:hypothetical protein